MSSAILGHSKSLWVIYFCLKSSWVIKTSYVGGPLIQYPIYCDSVVTTRPSDYHHTVCGSTSHSSPLKFALEPLLRLPIHIPGLQYTNRQRFIEQVGHETMFVSSGNKHFFTKSCQTYQNYEQPPQTSASKIGQIFPKKNPLKNIGLGDQLLVKNVFKKIDF